MNIETVSFYLADVKKNLYVISHVTSKERKSFEIKGKSVDPNIELLKFLENFKPSFEHYEIHVADKGRGFIFIEKSS